MLELRNPWRKEETMIRGSAMIRAAAFTVEKAALAEEKSSAWEAV